MVLSELSRSFGKRQSSAALNDQVDMRHAERGLFERRASRASIGFSRRRIASSSSASLSAISRAVAPAGENADILGSGLRAGRGQESNVAAKASEEVRARVRAEMRLAEAERKLSEAEKAEEKAKNAHELARRGAEKMALMVESERVRADVEADRAEMAEKLVEMEIEKAEEEAVCASKEKEARENAEKKVKELKAKLHEIELELGEITEIVMEGNERIETADADCKKAEVTSLEMETAASAVANLKKRLLEAEIRARDSEEACATAVASLRRAEIAEQKSEEAVAECSLLKTIVLNLETEIKVAEKKTRKLDSHNKSEGWFRKGFVVGARMTACAVVGMLVVGRNE